MQLTDLNGYCTCYILSIFFINCVKTTRGEGGLRPPSPLVWVACATLILSEEIVSLIQVN